VLEICKKLVNEGVNSRSYLGTERTGQVADAQYTVSEPGYAVQRVAAELPPPTVWFFTASTREYPVLYGTV